jgi:hypothetical protein
MSALLSSIFVAVIGAAYVGFAILAILHILRSRHDPIIRGLWIIVVLVAPLLGSTAWFVSDTKQRRSMKDRLPD